MSAPDSQWMAAIESQLRDGSARMDSMQRELTANTTVTTEVRDMLMTWKGAMAFFAGIGRFATWLTKFAGAGGVLYGLWYAATHGGTKPPPGAH